MHMQLEEQKKASFDTTFTVLLKKKKNLHCFLNPCPLLLMTSILSLEIPLKFFREKKKRRRK